MDSGCGRPRSSWITALTRPGPARTVGLARRGRQDRRTRDRIKDLRSAAGRFGRFLPDRAGVSRGRRRGAPDGSRSASRCRYARRAGEVRAPAVDPRTRSEARDDPTRRPAVDPARPIPPADQPARLDALEAAVRARTDLVPELGIVLGSGLGGLADELEDAVADPVRRAAGLAGGHRAGPCRPAAAGQPRRAGRSSCSRAASTCTRATTRAW